LSLLSSSKGLWLAAFDNNHNQQYLNKMGHTEWSGRINGRYGTSTDFGENAGPPNIENQASGPAWFAGDDPRNIQVRAARIVNEMVRDLNVADKAHRKNCMGSGWNLVGASVMNGWITMDFARSFSEFATVADCDIDYAVRSSHETGGATDIIELTFTKPVPDLALADIVFEAATTAAIEKTSLFPSDPDNDTYHWYLFVETQYAGNVRITVNKAGIYPWARTIPVVRGSSFSNLDDMKAFIGSQTTVGSDADHPIGVTLTGNALSGSTDADKVAALYAAIAEAGKYVNLTVSVPGLLTWPPVVNAAATEKITAIYLPMNFNGSTPIDTKVDASAFADNFPNLTLVYSFNVIEVGANAFKNCPKLTTTTMSRVATIGSNAYTGCNALARICVGSNLDLSQTGLPQGMVDKYNASNKAGGYNTSGDVTYVLSAGVWTKVN
jgi:hypothetical protein